MPYFVQAPKRPEPMGGTCEYCLTEHHPVFHAPSWMPLYVCRTCSSSTARPPRRHTPAAWPSHDHTAHHTLQPPSGCLQQQQSSVTQGKQCTLTLLKVGETYMQSAVTGNASHKHMVGCIGEQHVISRCWGLLVGGMAWHGLAAQAESYTAMLLHCVGHAALWCASAVACNTRRSSAHLALHLLLPLQLRSRPTSTPAFPRPPPPQPDRPTHQQQPGTATAGHSKRPSTCMCQQLASTANMLLCNA